MTFILFRENFQVQQYNLGIGKGEGKVEGVGVKGMGSGWRVWEVSGAANLPTPHHPRISDLFLRKS